MHTFVIAEAGVNHNGSVDLAKKLVDCAVKAGADAVKFQTFKADALVSKAAKKAEYQIQDAVSNETQYEMLKRLELSWEDYSDLIAYSKCHGIEFLSTPFDLESIDFLHEMGMGIFKIASGELINIPYLRRIGALQKEIFLSTGFASLGDIELALCTLEDAGTDRDRITVLHSTSSYPAPMASVNLKAIKTISAAFRVKVGFSDHSVGCEAAVAAVALGATVIEKHFTLDKTMDGPDHKASMEPDELIKFVDSIRRVEAALGDGVKRPSEAELPNIEVARKSIVANTSISTGELFTEDNLTTRRPGDGISSKYWDMLIGKRARRNYLAGEQIEY